ncbi:MAG: Crp/Fnr family transcriptional regulator [Gammaproteobacteria bacterium]|nr:Crp/Fnr family transcriptional regulator [Gammaproteobacteria bacterium]
MQAITSTPSRNLLLAALPARELDHFARHLELVPMPLGKVLYESDSHQAHVYFPTDCIVSLLYLMEDGHTAEIAAVGREGVVGVQLFMGGETMPNRAVVRSAGSAFRLNSRVLKDEFRLGGTLQQLLLRYAQALFTQTALTAVCNRHHTVDQQLCRSLLLSLDRLSCDQLQMTQELLASVLGVRREGVTEAAGKLQAAGIIRYSRGRISVMSRAGLEDRCCECYQVVRKELGRLVPAAAPVACAA